MPEQTPPRGAVVEPRTGRRILLGIALVCCANVLLEILMVRMFSAMMFYHFTFVAVALALFGLAASGVYVYARAGRMAAQDTATALEKYALLFSAAIVLFLSYSLAYPVEFPVPPAEHAAERRALVQVLALFCVSAAPFFFGGVVVSLAVSRLYGDFGRIYFYDLAAAGLAAALCGVLLKWLGGPSTVLLAAAMAAAAAVLFGGGRRRAWIGLGIAGALLAANLLEPFLFVPSVKTVQSGRVIFEKWNIFSRVTLEKVVWNDGSPGYDIKIDSAASTPLTSRGAIGQVRHPLSDFAALGHALQPDGAANVLIIGPGGGRDIVHALAAGAKRVTGVDLNEIIVETIMQEKFRHLTGDLYRDPRVRIVVDEGRSFVRRSAERFDVLQLSMVDTWAATASGAFALSENTLYTTEAFVDYLRHLKPEGIVTSSRWWGPETARLTAVAIEGLRRSGVRDADLRAHLYVARRDYPEKNEYFGTLIVKKSPLTDADLARLDGAAARYGFETILSPRDPGRYGFDRLTDPAPDRSAPAFPFRGRDLSATTDDRPFFFYFDRPADLLSLDAAEATNLSKPALWVLLASGASLVMLAAIFILLPMVLGLRRQRGIATPGSLRPGLPLIYFGALGLGFMLIEFGLMQKLTIFLGHPSYSLLVILFGLLAATSAGALLTASMENSQRVFHARAAGAVIVLLSGVFVIGSDHAIPAWIDWNLPARAAMSVLIVTIFGLPMGVMMPAGVGLVGGRAPYLLPWCWAMNGAMSVVGTVASLILSLHIGIASTLLCGAVIYAVATGVLLHLGVRPADAMRA